MRFEQLQVGVQPQIGVATHESADRRGLEQNCRIEHTKHEFMLLSSQAGVRNQHVVEKGKVRKSHAGVFHGGRDALRARAL